MAPASTFKLLCLGIGLPTACNAWLQPPAGTTWNIQLSTPPSARLARNPAYKLWDMDMADTSVSLLNTFHSKGHMVICYFSAGSVESWRDDADQFPPEAIGNVMEGWDEEKWVDIRNPDVRAIMVNRIQEAQAKGCDGVDPDNIDAWLNDPGFDLTSNDAVDYVHFLAQTAHSFGLGYGLKNGADIVDQVIDVSDWNVNEECVFYDECDRYSPFINQNKAVFHIEYPANGNAARVKANANRLCAGTKARGFSTIFKRLDLGSWTVAC